jgi:hypothetical protein
MLVLLLEYDLDKILLDGVVMARIFYCRKYWIVLLRCKL